MKRTIIKTKNAVTAIHSCSVSQATSMIKPITNIGILTLPFRWNISISPEKGFLTMYRIYLLFTLTLYSNSVLSDSVYLECNWSIVSEVLTVGQIYGSNDNSKAVPGSFVSLRKKVHHMSPSNCVSFSKPSTISLEDYQESVDAYLKPDQVNLSCPQGYSPFGSPTWNNINSTERTHGSIRYYLDSYVAKLTCLK